MINAAFPHLSIKTKSFLIREFLLIILNVMEINQRDLTGKDSEIFMKVPFLQNVNEMHGVFLFSECTGWC